MYFRLCLQSTSLRSIKKYYLCLLIALLSAHSEQVFSQYNLHFKSYTSSNGLPSGSFSEIKKSPNGYLWLHSENGISKFNGYDFTTYYFNSKTDKSFSSTQMLMSFTDSLGNLFLASKNALFFLTMKRMNLNIYWDLKV
ncbi:MAG: hypothetical protein IPJ26_16275 [Bacteroidetes bacterium]|nr:hypothetical protein [Bacteroidota bacterium]